MEKELVALHIVTANTKTAEKVLSQLKLVIRPMYSNPPMHGMLIANKILSNDKYCNEWREE